jgi:hypothetical protein
MYQSLSRKEDTEKEPQTTGHDRFCTHQNRLPRTYRRRKRTIGRRAQSFSELNTCSPASVKLGLRRQPSVSTNEENGLDLSKAQEVSLSGERKLLPVNRFDSLAKLFSCIMLSPNGTCSSHLSGLQRWVESNIQMNNNQILNKRRVLIPTNMKSETVIVSVFHRQMCPLQKPDIPVNTSVC